LCVCLVCLDSNFQTKSFGMVVHHDSFIGKLSDQSSRSQEGKIHRGKHFWQSVFITSHDKAWSAKKKTFETK